LWLGPGGSLSPLHHDTTHVFFNQLVGQKRYTLVAPWAADVLLGPISQPSDAGFDLTQPGDVAVHTLVIHSGQSLFIPAGWWHQVEALAPSISVSLSCYHRTADFDWYRPVRHPL
jgi:ribosomal protein L16 Arg81 hydroxylase